MISAFPNPNIPQCDRLAVSLNTAFILLVNFLRIFKPKPEERGGFNGLRDGVVTATDFPSAKENNNADGSVAQG